MNGKLSLDGKWKVRWADGDRGGKSEHANLDEVDLVKYIDAEVPGEIHLDVWREGLIQDPYVGLNVLSARWVEECIWSYRKEFDAPPETLRKGVRTWLNFEGLDLAATIVLNGKEIGKHNNSFCPKKIEVTGALRRKKNVLAVHLDGGLYEVSDKEGCGYVDSPGAKLHKRHWQRKPQCQFGWDWSPRFINIGINKPVSIEWTDEPVRVEQFVPLAELSSDLKTGKVRARLFADGLVQKEVEGKLSAELIGTGVRREEDVLLKPGVNPVETVLEIKNPELWWPVWHGKHHRYEIKVTLSVKGKVIGAKSAKIGFRHVRVNQEDHPEKGRYFIIEVNGRKIFAKGGNFVPADMIFARLDRERYDKITDLALESNFNFLRVWGGGLYENSDFFDICDEKGILVWQEFIFACAKYPTHNIDFYNSVKEEAVYNIRRLACHPSLVAWCGNNELEWGAWDWGYDKTGVVYPDYGWFHLTLPRIMQGEDPTRYYQPSSPFSPVLLNPNSDEIGDQHPWVVGMSNQDFRKYRELQCRFPNEGGFLGPVSLPTMMACLPEGHRKVKSFAWQIHDNSVDSCSDPSYVDNYISLWFGRDIKKMTVEEFTYWGGALQSEALREYCENFRRRMFDSASAIFWMFNDCWPATRSWTNVDYYLRRTPCFHGVRRAMAPVHVAIAEEDGKIKIFGINDTMQAVKASLTYGIFKLAGGRYPMQKETPAVLKSNASTLIASFNSEEWKNRRDSMPFAMLKKNGKLIARNRFFTELFKDISWPKSKLEVTLKNGRAVFTSSAFIWNICIDLNGEKRLADNFFDVYPGIPYELEWDLDEAPKVLFKGN